MSESRDSISAWINQVATTLSEAAAEDSRAHRRLPPEARWQRVRAACISGQRQLTDEKRERIERKAVADHKRWREVVELVRARARRQ